MKPGVLCAAALSVGIGATGWAQQAAASGFALRDNSVAGLGMAYAGLGSATEDLSTIFNNPAGMTRFSGNQAQFGGVVILPDVEFKGSGTSQFSGNPGLGIPPGAVATSGGTGGNSGQPALVPNFYAMFDVTPDLKVGIAGTAPFGLTTIYPSDWVGRYLGLKSAVLTLDLNPNVAYRVNNWLSVGVGVSAQYASADLSKAINQSGAVLGAPPNSVPGFGDAFARFDGSDWGFGYNLGVLLEPLAGTRVGLTYRSQVDHTLDGKVRFRNLNPAVAGLPLFASGNATADVSLPATAGISVTQAVTPAVSVSLDVQWTEWSSFKRFDVVRSATHDVADSTLENYRNSWFTALGATYKPNAAWTWRAGIAWDQTPVTDEFRTVRVPDADRYIVGLGLSYKWTENWRVDVSYAHYYMPRATMDRSVNANDGLGTTISGSYHLHADFMGVAAQFRF